MADEGDVAVTQKHEETTTEGQEVVEEGKSRGSNLRLTAEDVRETMGDAEDESMALLIDLVDAIFDEMRVREENERSIRVAIEASWRQTVDGTRMASTDTMDTMDAMWRQQVRPAVDEEDDVQLARPARLVNRNRVPVVSFLRDLWSLLESQTFLVETQLIEYPSSRFRLSAAPSHGRQGEWEIPAVDLGAFLRSILHKAHLSALNSVADFVVVKNAGLLAKKVKAKAHLQLPHIMMCVQTALLAAEDDEREQEQRGTAKISLASVFRTEVNDLRGIPRDDDLLAIYDEGLDGTPPTIDRAAAGCVARKPELASTVAKKGKMARNVVALFRRRESSETKWNALRKRVFVKDNHVGISLETNVEIAIGTLQVERNVSPKRKRSITSGPKPSPLKVFGDNDTATLANIFSLGTPRQLSADELARRNDILTLLEREEALATRRMAVASITAVGIPSSCIGPDGKPILSEHDKAFQVYAAANSSITMSHGSCHVPSSNSVGHTSSDLLRKAKGIGTSGSGSHGRTKFELALEHPSFDVFDGNTYAKMHASVNPTPPSNKKGKMHTRVLSPVSLSPSPTSPPLRSPQPPSPRSESRNQLNPRPLDTASSPLPQIDTSRLAAGVKAVVRGIEKRGPRHSPSRNSRLRLHNYTNHAGSDEDVRLSPKSVKTPAPPNTRSSDAQEHLPPVSPVRSSSHKKHVTFPIDPVSPHRDESPQKPTGFGSPQPPTGPRRFPNKQPTWEKRTSPPRVRNRHFSVSRKKDVDATWGIEGDKTLNAPRRNVLIPSNEFDGD